MKWRPPFPLLRQPLGSLRSPILFSPTPIFFPFTPNSGACCQASKLSFVGFSVLICQLISKTPCRIFVFDCGRCRHNINRQSFCHRLCFDRELDFVIYECSILDLKGVGIMKDRKFIEKATDVRCETEVSFTELT